VIENINEFVFVGLSYKYETFFYTWTWKT